MDAPWLEHVNVLATGLEHDRGWAVIDDAGTVVTAKQVDALREISASVPAGAGTPQLELAGAASPVPAGEADDVLATVVGRSVSLRAATAATAFNEVAPVHVVSRQSVERAASEEGTTFGDPACSIEQPRANVELDLTGELETAWIGRELHVGGAVLRVSKQPRHCLGVYADVVRPGEVSVGDDVRLG